MPGTDLPLAIVGCGLIGEKRARAWEAMGGRVAAVHDAEPARARALADRLGGTPVSAASAADAIGAAGPGGLVVVATTHDSLAPLAAEAVSGGCHVLVEKPGGRRPGELEEVAAEAAARRLTVRVGFNHRFHPAVLRLRELLLAGAVGDVLFVRARYGHGGRVGYEREWRADPERSGGGELLDQGVHLIDLVQFLVGPPALEHTVLPTFFWPIPVEDNAFLHLSVGARHAWLHASWTEWKNLFSFEVIRRWGKLEITGLGGSYGQEQLTFHEMDREVLGPPMTRQWAWPPTDASWQVELEDVVGGIGGAPAIGADVGDAMRVLSIVEQAYES